MLNLRIIAGHNEYKLRLTECWKTGGFAWPSAT